MYKKQKKHRGHRTHETQTTLAATNTSNLNMKDPKKSETIIIAAIILIVIDPKKKMKMRDLLIGAFDNKELIETQKIMNELTDINFNEVNQISIMGSISDLNTFNNFFNANVKEKTPEQLLSALKGGTIVIDLHKIYDELMERLYALGSEDTKNYNFWPVIDWLFKHIPKEKNAQSPLLYIAQHGSVELMQQIIEKGELDINARGGTHKYTPLIWAFLCENKETAKVLLDKGADVRLYDELGLTAMHYCAKMDNTEFCDLLLEKDKTLIECKAKIIGKENEVWTPFALAVEAGSLKCASHLATRYKCEVNTYLEESMPLLRYLITIYMQLSYQSHSSNGAEKKERRKNTAEQIKFLVELKADLNYSFSVEEERRQIPMNYFALAFGTSIQFKTLDALDYELIEIFINAGFDVKNTKLKWLDGKPLLLGMAPYAYGNKKLQGLLELEIQSLDKGESVHRTLEFNYTVTGHSVLSMRDEILNEMMNDIMRSFALLENEFSPLLNDTSLADNSDESEKIKESAEGIKATALADEVREKEVADIRIREEEEIKAKALANEIKVRKLSDEICETIARSIREIRTFAAKNQVVINIPKWCNEIKQEKLYQKNIQFLEPLRSKVQEWSEKTLIRLSKKVNPATNNEQEYPIEKEGLSSQKTITAIYESNLPFSQTLMLPIRGNEQLFLLLPFNENGDYGLNVIKSAKKMRAEDEKKFKRVLDNPTISNGKNQPGVKLFKRFYFCLTNINRNKKDREIIGEIKIADSPHRIALYYLNHIGEGPKVIGLGPFLEGGFHNENEANKQYEAHAMDFAPEIIKEVEIKILKSCEAMKTTESPVKEKNTPRATPATNKSGIKAGFFNTKPKPKPRVETKVAPMGKSPRTVSESSGIKRGFLNQKSEPKAKPSAETPKQTASSIVEENKVPTGGASLS